MNDHRLTGAGSAKGLSKGAQRILRLARMMQLELPPGFEVSIDMDRFDTDGRVFGGVNDLGAKSETADEIAEKYNQLLWSNE